MRKGQETRERIIVRAAELFNTRGYGATAISDVMEAVALEKGGIYRHFASKEELALAAFTYAIGIVRERMKQAVASTPHALEALVAVINVFRSYVVSPPLSGGCPLLNAAIESDDYHPHLRIHAQTALGELQTLLASTVRRGIEQGEIQPDVHAERVATLIIVTMEGAVMMSRLMLDPNPLYWAADHMQEYLATLRNNEAV